MKLQYLGTAAAEGIPAIFCDCENCKRTRQLGGKNIRTRSQALVDDTLLIDFPPDTYMHFLTHNIPLSKIKSCIITHSHQDHLYAEDIKMRRNGFANLDDKNTPLTFYSDKSGYDIISANIAHMSEKEAKAVLIKPFEPFEAEGYTITALRAAHDEKSTPVVYIIEKEGKSIFYSNDTSEYPKESMEYLKKLSRPLSLISLDCTEACNHPDYVGHLSLERCINLRNVLISENIADENTIFILNHFSHNGKNVVYDEFKEIAAEHNFMVSYDGMIVNI